MGEVVSSGYHVPMNVSLGKQFRAMRFVNELLRCGAVVVWALRQFTAKTDMFPNGHTFPAGDFLIPDTQEVFSEAQTHACVKEISEEIGSITHRILEKTHVESARLFAPRIAIYRGPGTWECYLWYVRCLETLGFIPETLTHCEIKNGKLGNYDILILPGGDETWQAYAFWPLGREKIIEFVRDGGSILGSCGGLDVAGFADGTSLGSPHSGKVKFLHIVDYDATRNIPRDSFPHDEWARRRYFHLDLNEYSEWIPLKWATLAPVRITKTDSPIVFGYPQTILPGLFYAAGPLPKNLGKDVVSVAEFAPDMLPEDSAWALPVDYAYKLLEGATAMLHVQYGRGTCVFFSPHPEEPSCSPHFRLVANAIFFLCTRSVTREVPDHYGRKPQSTKNYLADETMARKSLQQAFQTISEVKGELNEFATRCSQIKKTLGEWTYEHVPEWILRLPGHSQIWMPDLEVNITKEKPDEISQLILQLEADLGQLRRIENASETIDQDAARVMTGIASAINNVLVVIPSIRDVTPIVDKQLDELQQRLSRIVILRREIDVFKQPHINEERFEHLWKILDQLQYEFDSKIWEELMYLIDGKAEVSIYSTWKQGIIERESLGVVPQLIKLVFQLRRAHELARLIIQKHSYESKRSPANRGVQAKLSRSAA